MIATTWKNPGGLWACRLVGKVETGSTEALAIWAALGGLYTHADLLVDLRVDIARHTQSGLADQLGVSAQYLSDVKSGRREIGPGLLKALGYEKIVLYRKASP